MFAYGKGEFDLVIVFLKLHGNGIRAAAVQLLLRAVHLQNGGDGLGKAGEIVGDAFSVGTPSIYEEIYYNLTEGKPMSTSLEMARKIVEIIEAAHAHNPLEMKF